MTRTECVRRAIVEAAMMLRSDATPEERKEGMDFLLFAREWLRIGNRVNARNALDNALSVLEPLWGTERYIARRHSL